MAPNPFAFKGILFVLLTSCRLNKRNEAWGVPQCVLTLASKRQETSAACLMSPQEIMLDICILCSLWPFSRMPHVLTVLPQSRFLQPSTRLPMIELF